VPSREHVLLEGAVSTGNQGATLMMLAERLGDARMAQSAHSQTEAAHDEALYGEGQALLVAYYAERGSKFGALSVS